MDPLLTRSRIRLGATATDWTLALRESAALLEADDIVGPEYTEAILESFAKNGDYMIVVPEVVLSHARPEHGARRSGMSLLTLADPVVYTPRPDKTITAVFTLAATDEEQHLEVMQALAEILIDDDSLHTVLTSRAPAELLALFGQDG